MGDGRKMGGEEEGKEMRRKEAEGEGIIILKQHYLQPCAALYMHCWNVAVSILTLLLCGCACLCPCLPLCLVPYFWHGFSLYSLGERKEGEEKWAKNSKWHGMAWHVALALRPTIHGIISGGEWREE